MRKRVETILVSGIPRPNGDDIRIGEWGEDKDRTLRRTSFLPVGMSIDEAERIVGESTGRPTAAYDREDVVRRTLILDV